MREDLARAMGLLNRGRRYAPFFESTDKEAKELGVAEEFAWSLNSRYGPALSQLRLQRPDPPDLTATTASGGRVAIELAEIVCEESARRNAHDESVYRVWRRGELAHAISLMLTRKDAKAFHGGPFDETIVCLFTDEPALTIEAAMAELNNERFGPFACLTSSFLLFSYQPATKTYPVFRLQHYP